MNTFQAKSEFGNPDREPEENIGVRLCIEAALGRNIDNTGT